MSVHVPCPLSSLLMNRQLILNWNEVLLVSEIFSILLLYTKKIWCSFELMKMTLDSSTRYPFWRQTICKLKKSYRQYDEQLIIPYLGRLCLIKTIVFFFSYQLCFYYILRIGIPVPLPLLVVWGYFWDRSTPTRWHLHIKLSMGGRHMEYIGTDQTAGCEYIIYM